MLAVRRGIAVLAPFLACGCQQVSDSLFVDCAEAPGGRGSERRPYDTIGAALEVARAEADRVTVAVAAGTCDAESWPLALDFAVAISGETEPEVDADGWPTSDADTDTILTFPEDAEPPGWFFEITASDVTISNLSIDGRYVLGPDDDPNPPADGPSGISLTDSADFDLHDLRLADLWFGVLGSGNSGRVADNYLGPVNMAVVLHGDATGPEVAVEDNRLDYRINGIVISAGASATGGSFTARIDHNDVTTRFADTGPSTPAALRAAPALQGAADGQVVATFARNRVNGPAKYAILMFGGFPPRDGVPETGSLDVTFEETTLDEAAGDPVITFSHAAVPAWPCTLDPASDPETCPYLADPAWDYLEGARFEFHDDGALPAVRIDHPALDPIDGRTLGNVLVINEETIANQTFVVVP